MKKVADVVDLLQALADGKELECSESGGLWITSVLSKGGGVTVHQLFLSLLDSDLVYRIKRTPREVWIINSDDPIVFDDESDAYQEFHRGGYSRPIKFREVLDD